MKQLLVKIAKVVVVASLILAIIGGISWVFGTSNYAQNYVNTH